MSERHTPIFALAVFLLAGAVSAQAVYIQEYCNDPLGVTGLDTNGDGVAPTTALQADDEFVEIVNTTASTVNISGWTVADAAQIRHTFATGTMIPPGCAIVVFGGGDVTAFNAGGSAGVVASTGTLGLNNTADSVILADAGAVVIDSFSWLSGSPQDGDGESITRDPEGNTGTFTMHTLVGIGLSHSAGRMNGGTLYCPATLPMPALATYPGNGSDVDIEVRINFSVSNQPTGVHSVASGDLVSFDFFSPGGGTDFAPLAAAFQIFVTGNPTSPLTIPGDAAPSVWLSPLTGLVLFNGFASVGQPFAPIVAPGGFIFGPGLIPANLGGLGVSLMVQGYVFDVGINPVNIGTSNGQELVIL